MIHYLPNCYTTLIGSRMTFDYDTLSYQALASKIFCLLFHGVMPSFWKLHMNQSYVGVNVVFNALNLTLSGIRCRKHNKYCYWCTVHINYTMCFVLITHLTFHPLLDNSVNLANEDFLKLAVEEFNNRQLPFRDELHLFNS